MPVEIGEEERASGRRLAVEVLVEAAQYLVAAMQTFGRCPSVEVAGPGQAGGVPLRPAMGDPAVFNGWAQPVEAPLGGCLVNLFPGPLHHQHRTRRLERRRGPTESIAEVGDVVQRCARDNQVYRLRRVVVGQNHLPVVGADGRFRVDTYRLVAVTAEHGDEPAQRSAADLEHSRPRRRHVVANERPCEREPTFFRRHEETIGGRIS